MDRHRHRRVGHSGVGGDHIGDQVRWLGGIGAAIVRWGVVAGLTEVDLVALPAAAAFLAVAGIGVVRGDDPGSARRESVQIGVPPDHPPPGLANGVLLDPHLAQHIDGGNLTQPFRGPPVSDRLEESVAVPADLHGKLLPFGLIIR